MSRRPKPPSVIKPPAKASRTGPDPFPDDAIYNCTCGTPERSERWICCDSDACAVGWHHWECVHVTAEPSGDWFCPSCRNSSDHREAKPSKIINDNGHLVHKGDGQATKKTPTRGAKKGTAVKVTPSKRTKSKWVGWVEEGSEDESMEPRSKRAKADNADMLRARRRAKTVEPKGKKAVVETKMAVTKERAAKPELKESTKPVSARGVGTKKRTWSETSTIPLSAIRSTLPRLL